jgi:hypothetical protein
MNEGEIKGTQINWCVRQAYATVFDRRRRPIRSPTTRATKRGSEQRPTSSDDNRHGPSLSFLSTQLCQARFSNPSCLFEDLKLVIRNRGGNAGLRGGNHGGIVGHGVAEMVLRC